jgi:hypothetical protein
MKYIMQCDCGCCEDELSFDSDEAANAAVKKAGLMNNGTIIDDEGIVHTGLDTFYGIRRANVIETRNHFQILIDKIIQGE